jgi:hypothetical protein
MWTRTFLTLLAFLACAASITAGARGKSLDIPEPKLPAPSSPPAMDPSYVRLPFSISIDTLVEKLETGLPQEIGTASSFEPYDDGVEIEYTIRRGPLTYQGEHDEMSLGCSLGYWLAARGSEFGEASCGSASEPITGTLGSKIYLGWGDGWRLASRVEMEPTIFSLRCKPKPPGINFNNFLSRKVDGHWILPLGAKTGSVISGIEEVRSVAEPAWDALQKPVDLGGYARWLNFGVEGVLAGPLDVVDNEITGDLFMVVRPLISLGGPASSDARPLPDTKVRMCPDRVEVGIDTEILLKVINEQLNERFSSRVLESGDASIQVEGLRLSGGGSRLLVSMDVSGVADGTLYLTGDLSYDDSSFTLSAADLQYTKATMKAVFDVTDGVLRTKLDELRVEIADALTFDLEDRISTSIIGVGHGLNRGLTPDIQIRGGAIVRSVLGTYVGDESMGVRIAVSGQATLTPMTD